MGEEEPGHGAQSDTADAGAPPLGADRMAAERRPDEEDVSPEVVGAHGGGQDSDPLEVRAELTRCQHFISLHFGAV